MLTRIKERLKARREYLANLPMDERLRRLQRQGRILETLLVAGFVAVITSQVVLRQYMLAGIYCIIGLLIIYAPKATDVLIKAQRAEITFLRAIILEMLAVNHGGIVPQFIDFGVCSMCGQLLTELKLGVKCLSGHLTHMECLVREEGKPVRCPMCLHNKKKPNAS